MKNNSNRTYQSCIIDALCLIAYLKGEPQGKVIQEIMDQTQKCGDVLNITALDMLRVYLQGTTNHLGELSEFLALLDQLPIEVLSITKKDILETAKFMLGHENLNVKTAISCYFAKTNSAAFITADPYMLDQKLLPVSQVVYISEKG